MAEPRDTAGVRVPPPLIYFGFLVVGLVINYLAPFPFLPANVTLIVGIPLMAVGLLSGFLTIATMIRSGTSPDLDEPTKAIVTSGPYRFSRNPIYISFALIYLGIAAAFNALAALVFLPVALVVIDRSVIVREEKYLEQKFGEEYLSYKERVRRWV